MNILKVYNETHITNAEMIEALQKLGFAEVVGMHTIIEWKTRHSICILPCRVARLMNLF